MNIKDTSRVKFSSFSYTILLISIKYQTKKKNWSWRNINWLIRNGMAVEKRFVDIPSSNLKKRIAFVLKEENKFGFIVVGIVLFFQICDTWNVCVETVS